MALVTKLKDFIAKHYGPSGGKIMLCKFSVATTVLTALEQHGCTVARTTTGTYVITTGKVYKDLIVKLSVQRAAGAQTQAVWITASNTNTVTINQFTAADGTLVDTLSFTAHVEIFGRANS